MAEDDRRKPDKPTQARLNELNDIASLMSRPEGRRFMWRLLTRCGVYQSSFTGNSGTFFKEGERNVGLWILADIHETALDEFLTMMKEAKRDE